MTLSCDRAIKIGLIILIEQSIEKLPLSLHLKLLIAILLVF